MLGAMGLLPDVSAEIRIILQSSIKILWLKPDFQKVHQ
jgi:hypothetical protein